MKWISKLGFWNLIFQTGKKNPVRQTRYFKLENWKNPVQIDRGCEVLPNSPPKL